MKLRHAFKQIDSVELFNVLCILESRLSDASYTLEECCDVYSPAIRELLATPEEDNDWSLRIMNDSDTNYIDVSAWSKTEYVGESISLGGTPWKTIANAEIENLTDMELTEQVAYILWELTYDGWTEEEQQAFHKELIDYVAGKKTTI